MKNIVEMKAEAYKMYCIEEDMLIFLGVRRVDRAMKLMEKFNESIKKQIDEFVLNYDSVEEMIKDLQEWEDGYVSEFENAVYPFGHAYAFFDKNASADYVRNHDEGAIKYIDADQWRATQEYAVEHPDQIMVYPEEEFEEAQKRFFERYGRE